MADPKKHVLIFTFPASGHIIPMWEYARRVSQHHDVTFAISDFKADALRQQENVTAPPGSALSIFGVKDGAMQEITGPSDPNFFQMMFGQLFPGATQLMTDVAIAGSGKKSHAIAEGIPPIDVAVVDTFFGESVKNVCHERGISYYVFSTNRASIIPFLHQMNDDSPVALDPSEIDVFTRLPQPGQPVQKLPPAMKKMMLSIKNGLFAGKGIVFSSMRAMEENDLRTAEQNGILKGQEIYFVGPLMPTSTQESTNAETKKIEAWLDKKDPHSVVYISFGSIAVPEPEQITEIGEALVKLGVPFIWSLKEKFYEFLPEAIRREVPSQFDSHDTPFLLLSWAPQTKILAHKSTAMIVTHCGFNGMLESMSCGVPMVCWPMFADQFMNGEWLDENNIGLLIQGTGAKPQRLVKADEIAQAMKEVGGFGSKEESKFLVAAKAWKKKMDDAVSRNGASTQDFLQHMRSL